ncbi:cytochrome c [Citrifermentans bemidjiense Bem]|uniref:Cytochrome c n=1 Tax=Citrifermentans bemidjiense (strain ATCC BAA-1014 / DSM 16622 / JCM 12645 / Bem) TaxID=404380 RepID=B5EHF0_CITBB|nr:cytochrome c [Citrifermentans bemidjiense Bem]
MFCTPFALYHSAIKTGGWITGFTKGGIQLKIIINVVLAFAFVLISVPAFAFHSGGVAECEGCHSMHNSFEGAANVTGMSQYKSGPYLLKAQDQSGACLNCHQAGDTTPGPVTGKDNGYHISTAGVTAYDSTTPVELTPGGDFAWLKKTMTFYLWHDPSVSTEGDRHGHNIIAVDFGYTQDMVLTAAPGGTYPAANLACSSCHDPHGKYRRLADGTKATTGLPIFNSGSYINSKDPITGVSAVGVYRLLAGVGYQPKSLTGSYAFANPSPDALAPSSYNGLNDTIAGGKDRVAYGQGMSEWCANCHTAMHKDNYTSGTKGLVHPAGNGAKLTAAIAGNYKSYVSSGIAGTPASGGYSSLAPFELGSGDYAAIKTFQASPGGVSTSSNVLCLSCHRAHASAFESMTRYYLGNEFMTVADASNAAAYDSSTTENKINTGYSVTQQQNAYNGRPASLFGPYARDYCNKCHAKD